MYDTYMSEEAFDNLTAGDEVTVRSLDDLIHDFGADINVPCGWSSDMDELCGQTLIVDYVERDQIIDFGILHTKNCGGHSLVKCLSQKNIKAYHKKKYLSFGKV